MWILIFLKKKKKIQREEIVAAVRFGANAEL